MERDRVGGLFGETRGNAVLAWALTILLCALAVGHAFDEAYRWFGFTTVAVVIVLVPAAALRDPEVMPPWTLLALVAVPVVDAAVLGESFLTVIATYLAVAAVALVVVVEIHRFTSARMNHAFAVGLVVITTLAVAATWNVSQWAADALLGTSYIVGDRSQDAANHELMLDFVYAAIAGLLAGLLFARYYRVGIANGDDPGTDPREDPDEAHARLESDGGEEESTPSLVRGRLDVPESRVRQLSRALQVALGGVLLFGLVRLDLTTVVNAGIALAITFVPAILERDYRLPLEPELVFWLTAAVFVHSLGSAGLYELVPPLDNFTHAFSATVVAAAGYAVVRAIDLHTDEVYLPPKMSAAFILLFVLAFGVIWEIMEFAIDGSADWFGLDAVLAQHGIDDTIVDLVFDFVGAVVVAAGGSAYLTDVSHRLARRIEE